MPVRFLLAKRRGAASPLERALERGRHRAARCRPAQPRRDPAAAVRASRPDPASPAAPTRVRVCRWQPDVRAGARAHPPRPRPPGHR
jgi:hypothetical protein